VLLAAPASAWASGLTPPSVGHVWSGPVTEDAAATFWNPAMLAGIRKARVEGNLDLVFPSVSYTRMRRAVYQREDSFKFALPITEEDIDRRKTGNAGTVSAQNTLIPAGSVFAAVPVHERVTLGFGFFGLAAAIINFPDQGAARYQLQEASLLAMTLNAGVGVRVTDWFRVGASVYYIAGRMGLRKTADLAGTDLLGKALASPPINQPNDFGQSAPPGVRELSVLSRPFTLHDAQANTATFALGLAFDLSRSVTLGISYLHRIPLTLKGRFALDMNDDFFTQDLGAQGLKYPRLVEGDAYVEFPLPSSVKLGLAYQATSFLRLVLQAEYHHYSDIESFLVTLQSPDLAQPTLGVVDVVKMVEPRRWRNTVAAQGTAIFQVTKSLQLGATFGYQSSAAPDETVALASIDGDRLVGSVASRLTLGRWELTAALQLQHILTRNVVTSDFDLGNGTYKFTLVMLTGSVAVTF
jgi:long-chain fatty acid transport protein